MSSAGNSLVADNMGYKVSLLRVTPGKEAAVAEQLKSSIVKDSNEPPIAMLKLFGRFDICAIYKTRDYLDGPSKFGPIHGIRGANKINAFHWLSPGEQSGLSVEKHKGDVWALSFFRFNESVIKQRGLHLELFLARDWYHYIPPDVSLDVLGTTGWAELLLLIRGSRFKHITAALSSVNQQLITLQNRERTILPAKTLSILGIDFELTLGNKRRALIARLNEPFKQGTGVFPRLQVTCPPAAMKAVMERGRSCFGKGAEVLGATDFSFLPKRSNWGQFIANVLDLRTKLPGKIYSTSVSILFTPKALVDVPYEFPKRDLLRMPKPNSRCITRWGPTLEHRLRNLYFSLSNLMGDPLIGDCFEGLRLMAERRLPEILKEFDTKDQDQRDLLYELVDLVAYGTEERAHGAFLSLENLESSLSPTKGGIQRILAAAGTIPRSLLGRVRKEPWHGFVVAGYHNENFSSHCGILNLPFEYLFTPDQWCGLFHEVGHTAFCDKNFYNMDGEEMSKLLRRIAPYRPGDDSQFFKWKELAWEIGADMFDLYFCYGTDLVSYLRNIWPFLKSGSDYISSERFARYFLIYEFWKHLLVPKEFSFGRSIDVEAEIREFRKRLLALGLNIPIKPEAKDDARLSFAGMADIVEEFYQYFQNNFGAPRQLDEELDKPEMKRAIQTVSAGQPWLERIDEPETFILGLKQIPRPTLSTQLAAIVSLWHTANKPLPLK